MRRRRLRLILAITLLVPVMLVGCSSTSNSGKGGDLENIPWKLTNYLAADTLETVDPDVSVFAEFKDGTLAGKALNSYSASYEANSDGSLKIGQISSTLMAGPENVMAAEKAYFDALQKTASYTSDGETLKLFDAQGNELLIFVKSEIGLKGAWTVTGVNNGKEALQSVMASATLTMEFGDSGALSGNGGVNNYNAKYEDTGSGEITISQIASTKMAGPEELMTQEQQFFAALEASKAYQIRGTTLELRDSNGALQVTATR